MYRSTAIFLSIYDLMALSECTYWRYIYGLQLSNDIVFIASHGHFIPRPKCLALNQPVKYFNGTARINSPEHKMFEFLLRLWQMGVKMCLKNEYILSNNNDLYTSLYHVYKNEYSIYIFKLH